VLKRSWAGEVRNVSLLVAIRVNESGYREILGISEEAKEDKDRLERRRTLIRANDDCRTRKVQGGGGLSQTR
jgi:transposase-like protein